MAVNNLSVAIEGKSLLTNLNLAITPGTVHAIMGPNGSGKSSLAFTLLGHPRYEVTSGDILFADESILSLDAQKRCKKGLFLVFQHPYEIAGVSVATFLKEAYQAATGLPISAKDFTQLLHEKMDLLSIDHSYAKRELNVGFSGGEKKRLEMLQVLLLNPRLVILDEIDSGLDIDALQVVAQALQILRSQCPQISYLIITHYHRILDYIIPDQVHILQHGTITRSGGPDLARSIEKQGYATQQPL